MTEYVSCITIELQICGETWADVIYSTLPVEGTKQRVYPNEIAVYTRRRLYTIFYDGNELMGNSFPLNPFEETPK